MHKYFIYKYINGGIFLLGILIMTFEQTSELLSAINNMTMYAEARVLEFQSELADLKQVDKYEAKIAKAKQTIWEIANS